MTTLLCIGDIAIDLYVATGRRHVGGISFNVAWNAWEHGMDARVYSAVGSDDEGRSILRSLERSRFPSDGIVTRNGVTAQQRIVLGDDGERVFDGYQAGVLSTLSCDDLSGIPLNSFGALHVPLSDGLEALFDFVAHDVQGVTKIADISPDGPQGDDLLGAVERYADRFDLLFIGGRKEDLGYVREVSGLHPERVFVVTLGRHGVVAFHGDSAYEQRAMSVARVVDITGCGDGFQGAFIARWLMNRDDIADALCGGVTQGAKVAALQGATSCVIEDPL
jgi:fructoselysine 6-kinase